MKINLPKIRIPLSKLDFILLLALGQIGAGMHHQFGLGWAMLTTGSLLLFLGLLMARGASK